MWADAGFAGESGLKSQTGVVLRVAGNVVGWLSLRQPFLAQSSAETELLACGEGLVLCHALSPAWRELTRLPVSCLLVNDNVAANTLFNGCTGNWRTRHLRLRAQGFVEQLENTPLEIHHAPGTVMLGDLGTKALHTSRIKLLLGLMGCRVGQEAGVNLEAESREKENCADRVLAAVSLIMAAHVLQGCALVEAPPESACPGPGSHAAFLAEEPAGSFWLLVGLLCVLSVGLWEALKWLVRWVWCRGAVVGGGETALRDEAEARVLRSSASELYASVGRDLVVCWHAVPRHFLFDPSSVKCFDGLCFRGLGLLW